MIRIVEFYAADGTASGSGKTQSPPKALKKKASDTAQMVLSTSDTNKEHPALEIDPTLDPNFNRACIGRLLDQLINPIVIEVDNIANNKINEKTVNKLHLFIELFIMHIKGAFWPNGDFHFFRSTINIPGEQKEQDIIVTAGTPGVPESLRDYASLYMILKDGDAIIKEEPPFVPRKRLIQDASFHKLHAGLNHLIEPLTAIKDFPLGKKSLTPQELGQFEKKRKDFYRKLEAFQRNIKNIPIELKVVIPQ